MDFDLKEYLQEALEADVESGGFEKLLEERGSEIKEYFYRTHMVGIGVIDNHLTKDQCSELFTHAAACIHDLVSEIDELSMEDMLALMAIKIQTKALISLVGMGIVFGLGLAATEEWR